MAAAEQGVDERMILWNDDNEIDILVFGELVNSVVKIVHADEVELGIELGKHHLHLGPFAKVLFG